ncbi:WbqC family protein [Lewinella sp. JB7]|uniref:WbqC family protein n=1 Tax=Lewinella sp. JB7 TaxID=2962887 RepID=UPI0020C9F754|nr:WbqC family protein [Lewinella sp. JB7]MCP9235071.1 WbqC family protein [Lewinella sp. JB7]
MLTSTAYFPPLTWFLNALDTGSWTWEAHENYQKGGYRNRCRIVTANGPQLLSVPLTGGKHQQMPVREVRISYVTDWQRQHEQALRSAYGRAPYFEHYADDIFAVAGEQRTYLWDHNWAITAQILELLQLPVSLHHSKQFMGADAGAGHTQRAVPPYRQVFGERHGFVGDLSILDGLFCLGPEIALL